jgi:hypothetical protein
MGVIVSPKPMPNMMSIAAVRNAGAIGYRLDRARLM